MNLKAMAGGVIGALLPVLAVTAFVASGPVGWVVGGVVAAGAAAYAGYQCNQGGGSFFGNLGKGIIYGAGAIVAATVGVIVAGATMGDFEAAGKAFGAVGKGCDIIFNNTLWWMGPTGGTSGPSNKVSPKEHAEEKQQQSTVRGTNYEMHKRGITLSAIYDRVEALESKQQQVKLNVPSLLNNRAPVVVLDEKHRVSVVANEPGEGGGPRRGPSR